MADNQPGFEIPEQMREFADKSMDQARKAFDDFMSATQQAVTKVEGSTSAMQSGASDINKKAMEYAEEHMNSAFDFAQKLVRAGDANEMLELHKEYMRKQMETLGEQARELSDKASKTAQDASKASKP
ncbi:phasin [Rhizobiales bacterium]|uniref:phasin n=1 Tax=Hongsoonwoonella zoysiae TaxID=2821844 RepID=UPI00156073C5|nr:phasin [Hongsoonwoonella zoysiae]NRG19917.1 phasin [Hongsoonwoonella zoysiae]